MKKYKIGFSESAMYTRIAGKEVTIDELVKGKIVMLYNPSFLHGYYLWDWGYTILDNNTISLN